MGLFTMEPTSTSVSVETKKGVKKHYHPLTNQSSFHHWKDYSLEKRFNKKKGEKQKHIFII